MGSGHLEELHTGQSWLAVSGDAIGPHPTPPIFAKEDEKQPSWWPTVTKLLFIVAVVSLLAVVFQGWEVYSCHNSLSELHAEAASKASDWEADKHNMEECRAEIERLEEHLKKVAGTGDVS